MLDATPVLIPYACLVPIAVGEFGLRLDDASPWRSKPSRFLEGKGLGRETIELGDCKESFPVVWESEVVWGEQSLTTACQVLGSSNVVPEFL